MTVIAIFAVVTATVMANYKDFGQRTMLKNLAYSVALAIREAQVSGLTGRNFDIASGAGDYYATYGIYFNMNTPTHVTFFKDRPTLGAQFKFDDPLEEIPTASFDILGGNRITGLCIYSAVNANCTPVSKLHISFKRPQPDAYIYSPTGGPFPRASIELSSRTGLKLYVFVEAAGQIGIQKNP